MNFTWIVICNLLLDWFVFSTATRFFGVAYLLRKCQRDIKNFAICNQIDLETFVAIYLVNAFKSIEKI